MSDHRTTIPDDGDSRFPAATIAHGAHPLFNPTLFSIIASGYDYPQELGIGDIDLDDDEDQPTGA